VIQITKFVSFQGALVAPVIPSVIFFAIGIFHSPARSVFQEKEILTFDAFQECIVLLAVIYYIIHSHTNLIAQLETILTLLAKLSYSITASTTLHPNAFLIEETLLLLTSNPVFINAFLFILSFLLSI